MRWTDWYQNYQAKRNSILQTCCCPKQYRNHVIASRQFFWSTMVSPAGPFSIASHCSIWFLSRSFFNWCFALNDSQKTINQFFQDWIASRNHQNRAKASCGAKNTPSLEDIHPKFSLRQSSPVFERLKNLLECICMTVSIKPPREDTRSRLVTVTG